MGRAQAKPTCASFADMADVVLGRAEHDDRARAVLLAAQGAQEFDAGHVGHVPIEQDEFRHAHAADIERARAVFGLVGFEIERLENLARDLADHAAVIDDQTMFHGYAPRIDEARMLDLLGKGNLTVRPQPLTRPTYPATNCTVFSPGVIVRPAFTPRASLWVR
jgi:hypothetical protein